MNKDYINNLAEKLDKLKLNKTRFDMTKKIILCRSIKLN